MFPQPFIHQMRTQLGAEDWALLEAALQTVPPVSIRLNPAKLPLDKGLLPPSDGMVPWHPMGYYLKERPVFTLDPLFHAGAYYVQEASSMFVYEVLRQTGRLSRPLRVLDLCAAPGGKTTLLHDAVGGMLTANEIVPGRAAILRENLEKWGMSHSAVVCADPVSFEPMEDWFDLILVDAPCSGEGMFRKDPDAIREWSPDNVQVCTARQSNILEIAKKALAPGGLLVYSTCTYNQQENEWQMQRAFPADTYREMVLDITAFDGVLACGPGYRFMPHRVRGEGFYIAAFEKNTYPVKAPKLHNNGFKQITALPKKLIPVADAWLNQPEQYRYWQTPSGDVLALPADREQELMWMDKYFKSKWFGCVLGAIKGNDLVPSHSLALSGLVQKDIPRLELSREAALVFLKKETFDIPATAPKGWTMVTYSGLPLGWIKILPGRMNNYLPPERRIRMDLKAAL